MREMGRVTASASAASCEGFIGQRSNTPDDQIGEGGI